MKGIFSLLGKKWWILMVWSKMDIRFEIYVKFASRINVQKSFSIVFWWFHAYLMFWNDTLVILTFWPFGHGTMACRVTALWPVMALWRVVAHGGGSRFVARVRGTNRGKRIAVSISTFLVPPSWTRSRLGRDCSIKMTLSLPNDCFST